MKAFSLTADRMLEIEQASVVGGQVVGDNLHLTTKGGTDINAGNVRGPQGVAGTNGTNGKNANAGRMWDNMTAYVVDDVVGYAGRIWKAKANNSDACPAFNLDKWTALTGMDAEGWVQNDPYFAGNNLDGWELYWRGGTVDASLTSVAGEFETGQQAMKLGLLASSTQRLYEREENLIRGGETVTVHVRAKLTAAATGLTIKASLFQAPGTGSPQPFGSNSSEVQSQQGAVVPTTSWQTFTFTMVAMNGKPRARVNLLIEQDASGGSTLVIDRVKVSRVVENRLQTFQKQPLMQTTMSGGGIRKVNATGVGWTQRFIIMGMGQFMAPTQGFYNIDMPADGTVIPVYGSTSGTSVTVAGGIIPLSYWRALYYDVPIGQASGSQAGRFKIVDYNAATVQDIPPTWVLVAVRQGDSLAPAYKFGDGQVKDYWRDLPLSSGYVAWGTNKVPQYRLEPQNKVMLKGWVKVTSGTFPAAATQFATMPSGFLPPDPSTGGYYDWAVPHSNSGGATGNTLRIELNCTNGAIGTQQTNTYQTFSWLSLDNCGYPLD